MIIDLILGFLEKALTGLASLFPTTPALDWLRYFALALDNLGALNYYLPISEMVTAFVAVMLMFPFFAGTSLLLWILAQLRGSSSRG